MTIRIHIRGHALTVLAAYAEQDWSDDDETADLAAACEALRAGGGAALVFNRAAAAAVADGLVHLANVEGDGAEIERRRPAHLRDTERIRMMRSASAGLSGAAQRVQSAAEAAA